MPSEDTLEGLKLRGTRKYDIGSSGITPLVFDAEPLILKVLDTESQVSGVTIVPDTYKLQCQTGERSYHQLVCPVYRVRAFVAEPWSELEGVIRPRINESATAPFIHTSLPPSFHFRLRGGPGVFIGHSVRYVNGILTAEIDKDDNPSVRVTPRFRVGALRDPYTDVTFRHP